MPAFHRLVARATALLLLATTLALGLVVSTTTSASADERRGPQRAARADLAEPTATITGLVHDAEGELVDNIQVEAFAADAPDGAPVASDLTYEEEDSATHGAYTLHVPAGRYVVRFSSPEWHARAFETVYYGGGAGTPVTVVSGDDKLLRDVTLVRDTGVTVTGKVTGAYAAADVSVDLYRVIGGERWIVDSATVARNGTYSFPRVNRNRTYTVAVQGWDEDESPVYPRTFLGQQPAAGLATTFTVPAGSTSATVPTIDVVTGTLVSGTVQQVGGAPVSHVHFEFIAVSAASTFGLGEWHSSIEGGYADRLLPGTYTVAAYDYEDDGEYVYLGDTYDLDQAETFTVPATGSVPLAPITIAPDVTRATVTGTVAVRGGAPVPTGTRAQLLVRYDDEEEEWDSLRDTAVNADGTFAMSVPRWAAEYEVLSVGIYDEDDQFETTYLGDVTSLGEASTFAPPAAGTSYPAGTITVAAPQRTAVSGTVLRGGEPAEGVQVSLYVYSEDWGWDSWDGTRTGADGSYDLQLGTGLQDEGYSALTVLAEGSGAWSETFLGGAQQIEDATTVDLPARGETVALDPIEQVRIPGFLSGRVLTEDGGSLGEEYDVRTELLRWTEPEWAPSGYWDSYDNSWSYRSPTYAFQDLAPGTYTVRAAHYSYTEQSPYLPTYANGSTTAPAGPGAPGTFVVTEDSVPTTGPTVTLRRGVALTGTVTAPSGLPLADVDVQTNVWSPSGLTFPASGTTDAQGHYSIMVPPETDVLVSTDRSGFAPFWLGGVEWPQEQTAENGLAVGTTGTTLDIELTPVWGDVGLVAGERSGYCLQHSSYYVEFGGRELSVDGGSIYANDDAWDFLSPFGLADQGPVLSVGPSWGSSSNTWGISPDGQTLCVVLRGRDWDDDSTSTVQALLTNAPGGGFDVTYNYDAIGSSPAGAELGFTEGEGAAGRVVVFPGGDVEDGYADSNPATGLVHHSRDSDQPGRYVFHFDGFNERGAAPETTEQPTITGSPGYGVGATLTAHTGDWTVDGDEAPGLALTYRWRRSGGKVLQDGPSPTYVVPASEATRRIYVQVVARVPWHVAGYASSDRVQVGDPAATNTKAPAVTPGAGRVGDTFTADPGAWTPASGVTDELTYDYQWFVNGRHYANGDSFYAEEGLEGASIKVRVLVSAPGHVQARAVSAPVTLAPLPPVPWSTRPAVSGTPEVGRTLVLTPGAVASWLDSATSVRWSVGGRARNANRGSAGLAYTPTVNDLGKAVTVRVTTSAPGHSDATWTASTALVVAAGTVTAPPTGTVSVSGTPALGQTLKATLGPWTVSGLTFAYSWTVDGRVVATGGSFKVPASAVGKLVAVVAQATKTGHPAGSATSAAVRIAKVRPVVSLKVGKATGKKGKKARTVPVTVTVTAAGLRPTGTVTVRIGSKVVGTVRLTGQGKATLKLKLKKGKHKLVAGFAGSATLAATSKTLSVKVR